MPHYSLQLASGGDDDARDIVTIWMDRPRRVLTDLPLNLAKRVVTAMNEAHAAGYSSGHNSALNEATFALEDLRRQQIEAAADGCVCERPE